MSMLWTYLLLLVWLTLLVGGLHLLPRLGGAGARLSRAVTHAPLLDVVIFKLTMGPPIVGLIVGAVLHDGIGWALAYLGVALLAQYTALLGWCRLHELRHRRRLGTARMKKSLNRILGRWCNAAALYWMLLAVPMFNALRLVEYLVYPVLVKLTNLPRYRGAEWVNVTRHKFDGLVGADRIWCLYCDWMTGIWSLGSEMLRNIESLWCPIRFGDASKCENCKLDFPDVEGRWVPFESTVLEAASLLDAKYPGPGGVNAWLGHPVRLTVNQLEPGRREGEPSEPIV